MKAAMNGGLNLSIRDGWWDEWPPQSSLQDYQLRATPHALANSPADASREPPPR
jgi:hypothetical protein